TSLILPSTAVRSCEAPDVAFSLAGTGATPTLLIWASSAFRSLTNLVVSRTSLSRLSFSAAVCFASAHAAFSFSRSAQPVEPAARATGRRSQAILRIQPPSERWIDPQFPELTPGGTPSGPHAQRGVRPGSFPIMVDVGEVYQSGRGNSSE